MNFKNFDSEDAKELVQRFLDTEINEEDFCQDTRITLEGDTYYYDTKGRPKCWLCTLKHFGSAWAITSELPRYPHYFPMMVGELYQAYTECPSKELKSALEELYTTALENNTVPDFIPVAKLLYPLYEKAIRN